jgi:hypothetical protein
MMKRLMFFVSLVSLIAACGGSMSDEQRKKMLEAREGQAIVKISEAEIMTAAVERGRAVMELLPDSAKRSTVDSIERVHNVKIQWLVPGATTSLAIEQQLIDAYINSVIEGASLEDNIQAMESDSMLYTKPVVVTHEDQSVEIKGTWNIRMSKKELVLLLSKKHY